MQISEYIQVKKMDIDDLTERLERMNSVRKRRRTEKTIQQMQHVMHSLEFVAQEPDNPYYSGYIEHFANGGKGYGLDHYFNHVHIPDSVDLSIVHSEIDTQIRLRQEFLEFLRLKQSLAVEIEAQVSFVLKALIAIQDFAAEHTMFEGSITDLHQTLRQLAYATFQPN